MAGLGSRFLQEGFTLPKPLIEVNKKPLIQNSIESLKLNGKYTFIIRKCENPIYFEKLLSGVKKIGMGWGDTMGRFVDELKKQKDPRVLGNGNVFDNYPFADSKSTNFYERYMNGEKDLKYKTNWANSTDYESDVINP